MSRIPRELSGVAMPSSTEYMSPDLAFKALEASPDATVIIDETGRIRFASQQTAAMLGYGDEIIGLEVEQLLPERFRNRHVGHRNRYFSSMQARPMGVGLDLFARRKDGSEFPVEISLSPIQHEGQRLVAAAIRDASERKRVEAELRFIESIAETALSSQGIEPLIKALLNHLRTALHSDSTTILLLDPDGQHLTPFASDGLEADLGGEISIPVGRGIAGRIAASEGPVIFDDLQNFEVISPVLRNRIRSVVGMALKTTGHLVGVVHAGSATVAAFTMDHGRLLSLAADRIGIAIERTRLQESERQARRAAEAANRQKSAFLATASHDLRQPLQTLSLANGALRRLVTDKEAGDAIAEQEVAIDGMSRLLNALLDISKLESGAIKPDPTDFLVNEIFEELRREFSTLARNKGLELRVESCHDSACSDPSLVGQILRNLLANAIKYTRAGIVTLRCLHQQPSLVRLEVLDTGIGIPEDKLQFIFDEFYQVGVPANSTREGYGLGLSIVQRIVKLLGAQLDMQSRVGHGSSFVLTLPTGKADVLRQRIPSKPAAPAHRVRARVLLVEDDQAVRNATRMFLRAEGFEVIATASVNEALSQARSDAQFDVLITDYHLQNGETGIEAISGIRSALNRPINAVLITGDTSAAVAKLARDDRLRIVSKPVNPEHLLNVLASLLSSN